MSAGTCSDPLNVGCTREVGHVAISLPHTPPNHKGKEPCQSCRRKRAMAERAARGLPKWRAGHRSMERL